MLTEFDIERYLLVSSIMLILLVDFTMSSNLVQAIVCLIFSYLIVATHFMLLNATYLAIVLILVYVGAISVLFLWLLMTIEEVDEVETAKVTKEKKVEEKKDEKTYENYYKYFVVRRILFKIKRFFKPLTDYLIKVFNFVKKIVKWILIIFTLISIVGAMFYFSQFIDFLQVNPFFREPYYIWSKHDFDMNDMFFWLGFLFYFLGDNIVVLG